MDALRKRNSKEVSEKFEKYLIFIQKILLIFKISLALMSRIFFFKFETTKQIKEKVYWIYLIKQILIGYFK